MVVYMQVTKDKYELPMIICDNVYELAQKCNVSPFSIYSAISRHKNGEKGRYRRVEFDESEE